MSEWITPKEGWLLRPTQDGLELITKERGIGLEYPSYGNDQDELTLILSGAKNLSGITNEVREVLYDLVRRGILQISKTRPERQNNPDTTLWKIRKQVVGSMGPVQAVYWLNLSQSKLSLSRTHLFTAKYRERTGHAEETQEAWASGSDTDWEQAEFKAIMEALERHASGVIPQEQLIRTTARKLGNRALDPRRVVAYTRTQYRKGLPFVPFSQERKYWWKSLSLLPEGEEKYLPVECLYYPVGHELTPNLYTVANSSGVAAGLTFEDALLRALYETIERDAFMATWLSRASMPLIDQRTIPNDCQERVHSLVSLGYYLYLVDITIEFVPVVLALAVSEQVRPALVLGAAANPDIRKAISKALGEVEYQLYWEWRDQKNIHSISDPTQVRRVLDHKALYSFPEYLPKAAFLWSSTVQSIREPSLDAADVWAVIEKLRQHNIETAVLDLTPEYLKGAGTWVVRTIPMGLTPISFGYGAEPLGMSRYWNREPKKKSSWPRNVPFPHPFS